MLANCYIHIYSNPDSSFFCILSLLQIQDDLTVYVAEPRLALGQRCGEEAPAGLWLRPRRSLRQNQGLHPDAAYALQPGGAASWDGAENCPLPPEGETATFPSGPKNSDTAYYRQITDQKNPSLVMFLLHGCMFTCSKYLNIYSKKSATVINTWLVPSNQNMGMFR